MCLGDKIHVFLDVNWVKKNRHALMAEWALPQTACYLSPLPGFEIHIGHVKTLAVTWC